MKSCHCQESTIQSLGCAVHVVRSSSRPYEFLHHLYTTYSLATLFTTSQTCTFHFSEQNPYLRKNQFTFFNKMMEVLKAANVETGPTFTNHLVNDHISARCSLLKLHRLTLKVRENERTTTLKNKSKMVWNETRLLMISMKKTNNFLYITSLSNTSLSSLPIKAII